MLLRIENVQHVGRFAVLKHKAPQFAKLTLIYARNGFGKSTLCALLRSLSDGNPNHVLSRKRLGAPSGPNIHMVWRPNRNLLFSNATWNDCPGKFHLFDQHYVQQNVHVGDAVTRHNKRSLLPVILGSDGVALAEKITSLDSEQRSLVVDQRSRSAAIRTKHPVIADADLLKFCIAEIPADLLERKAKAQQALDRARHDLTVQQKRNLARLPFISLSDYEVMLQRTLEGVSAEAITLVKTQIHSHQLGQHGDRWLKFGIEHIASDHCPFCAQPVSGLEIIDAYKAYLSEALAEIATTLDTQIVIIEAALAPDTKAYIEAVISENKTDHKFWSLVCDLPSFPDWNAAQSEATIAGLSTLLESLKEKRANPLAAMSLKASGAVLEPALKLISDYNTIVDQCATAIETTKADSKASNVKSAEETYQKWVALEDRNSEPLKTLASDYSKMEARRKEIEPIKRQAQESLKAFAATTMGVRQSNINSLLSDFGTNFSIVNARASFVGRDPNTDYAISIDGQTLPVGESSETAPSFKTVLSAGDKTTLALAFFITQVKADADVGNSIVVLDDPFGSQDLHRQFETTCQIRSIAALACQTIVLSHDPRFLANIEKDSGEDVATFQIECNDDGEGAVRDWSSSAELEALYIRQAEMIRAFALRGELLRNVLHVTLQQAIRPFLEDYIRLRFPGRFAAGVMLNDMVTEIEKAGADDELFRSLEALRSLNEYTRTSMHGGADAPNPEALRAQCKKVCLILGNY